MSDILPIVTVEGRAATDPELRFAPSGMAVGRFRMVASSRKKDEGGNWVDDRTLWIDVTVFRQLAEHCAESVAKGDLLLVQGRLQTDEWTTDGGEKRSKIVLLADAVGPSLQFRAIPHGAGRVQRSSSAEQNDPWASASSGTAGGVEEPPF